MQFIHIKNNLLRISSINRVSLDDRTIKVVYDNIEIRFYFYSIEEAKKEFNRVANLLECL